jgi:UDP-glucose 4-epimerase
VNILIKTISNPKLKKDEIINLTTGKATKVSKLIKLILEINKKQNYKVIEKKRGTAGDSFGFDANNNYLKNKFPDYNFMSIKKGLKKYFEWINKIPVKKNLKNYHPLIKN